MLSVDYLQHLTEPVRDSWLQASFRSDGQKRYTIHTHTVSHRSQPRQEIWAHEKDLGHGGFGLVQLQSNTASANPPEYRVIKSVRVTEGDLRVKRATYVRELEALTKFSHKKYRDFFVKFYGWYDSPGWIHIAMEYFELGDFQSYLKNPQLCPHSRLPEDQVQDITSQLVDALSLMHGENFAHRDLKPANILIKQQHPEQWWVKLCDLGLSKRVEDTASTVVRGTPGFMPPELLGFGREPRKDACLGDMWCLGELTYQALTGRVTFTFAELGKYCAGLIPFPRQPLHDIGASEEAIGFIEALMKVKPLERLSAQKARSHVWMETSPGSQPGDGLNVSQGQSEWPLEVLFTPQTSGTLTASVEWTAVTNPQVASNKASAAEGPSTTTQISTKSIASSELPTNLFDPEWLRGHAQAGREPIVNLAFQPEPPPRFAGSSSPSLGLFQAQQTSSSIQVPDLSPQKAYQYACIFKTLPLEDGVLLPKNMAQPVFKISGLSDETLEQVWRLSDSEGRATLSRTEFIIAMHLLTSMRGGIMKTLPNALPAKLYDAAIHGAPASPQPSVDSAGSGETRLLAEDWAITPSDRLRYDRVFNSIVDGDIPYVTGEVGAAFFRMSGLSDEVLGRIWQLADTETRGGLNRYEFAIAMHLIGKERR